MKRTRAAWRTGCSITITIAIATIGLSAPAEAFVPRPLQAYPPPTASPSPLVDEVVGETPAGHVFVLDDQSIAVRRMDGSARWTNEFVTDAAVGHDGRAWGTKPHCEQCNLKDGIVAVTEGGTVSEYPVPVESGQVTPVFTAIVPGLDRIWFLDVANDQILTIATDGSDLRRWASGPIEPSSRIISGPDDRMWFSRGDETVGAIDVEGTITTVATLSAVPGPAMASFDGVAWVVVGGQLRRIGADGSNTFVRQVNGVDEMAVANGRLWLLRWRSGPLAPDLMGIDADGVITTIPIPHTSRIEGFDQPFGPHPGPWTVLATMPSLAATGDGQDLLGTTAGVLWRIDSPVPRPVLTISGSQVKRAGHWSIEVNVTVRAAGGTPLSGSVDIVLWGTSIDGTCVTEGHHLSAFSVTRRRVATVALDSSGRASARVAVTPSMAEVPHDFYCGGDLYGVAAEHHSRTGGPQSSSTILGFASLRGGPGAHLNMGRPMTQVAAIYETLVGNQSIDRISYDIDDAGAVYWADRLATGRTSPSGYARTVVGSTTWRRWRVTRAYQTWFGRNPDSGGLQYWADWLETHTTTDLDLQLGGTAAARDADGTSVAARAQHLADAIGYSRASEFEAKLRAGTSWTRLLQAVYADQKAVTERANRIRFAAFGMAGSGSGATEQPGTSATTSQVAALLTRTGDEREAYVVVAAGLGCIVEPPSNLGGLSCAAW